MGVVSWSSSASCDSKHCFRCNFFWHGIFTFFAVFVSIISSPHSLNVMVLVTCLGTLSHRVVLWIILKIIETKIHENFAILFDYLICSILYYLYFAIHVGHHFCFWYHCTIFPTNSSIWCAIWAHDSKWNLVFFKCAVEPCHWNTVSDFLKYLRTKICKLKYDYMFCRRKCELLTGSIFVDNVCINLFSLLI